MSEGTVDLSRGDLVSRETVRQRYQDALHRVFFVQAGRYAFEQLDLERCEFGDEWMRFDTDAFGLASRFSPSDESIETITLDLSRKPEIRDSLRFVSEANPPNARESLQRLRANFGEPRLYLPTEFDGQFHQLCCAIAEEIERDFFATVESLSEELRHQQLLLIEFFRHCRLTTAALINQQLGKLRKPILGIRGSLLRIPEHIPRTRSEPLNLEQAPFELRNPLSATLHARAVQQIFQDLLDRTGVLRRFCGTQPSEVTEHLSDATQHLVTHGRQRDFAMFEYNSAISLILSTAEQSLRSASERHGISNFRTNRPVPAFQLAKRLATAGHLGADGKQAAEDLFHSKRGNIRNRMAHAAWADTEAKYLEAVLDHDGAYQNLPHIDSDDDPHSPRAFAMHVASLGSTIIKAVEENGGRTEAHCSWMDKFDLNSVIEFGHSIEDNFLRSAPETLDRTRQVNSFMHAAVPVADMYHRVTVLGFLRDNATEPLGNADFLIAFYFSQTVFEALLRSVAIIYGRDVLKTSRPREGSWNINYQVLSTDSSGFLDRAFLNEICECLPSDSRELGLECVQNAFKLRDAAAHGAMVGLTPSDREAVFKIYWRTVELLCEAGRFRLVRDAAYNRFVDRGNTIHGYHLSDWEHAEREIDNLIRDHDDSPRRYESLRSMGLIMPDDATYGMLA